MQPYESKVRLIAAILHSSFFFTQIIIVLLCLFSFWFLVCFVFVWFVLSSSWDHSPRCHWPCLAELCERDAEALRPLPHSWPSGGRWPGTPMGGTPKGQAEGDNYPKHCRLRQNLYFTVSLPGYVPGLLPASTRSRFIDLHGGYVQKAWKSVNRI